MTKVSFPTLEDLLHEAKDPVRVVTIMRRRSVKYGGKNRTYIPHTSFSVVVTARLNEGCIGEYVYQVGDDISYWENKIKEIAERSIKVEEEIKRQVAEAGRVCLAGQYTKETVLGVKP